MASSLCAAKQNKEKQAFFYKLSFSFGCFPGFFVRHNLWVPRFCKEESKIKEKPGFWLLYPLLCFLVYKVATYRGVSQKWETVTVKDTKESAERLLLLLSKVRPDFSSKIFSL
jgi:hypothetical protein